VIEFVTLSRAYNLLSAYEALLYSTIFRTDEMNFYSVCTQLDRILWSFWFVQT